MSAKSHLLTLSLLAVVCLLTRASQAEVSPFEAGKTYGKLCDESDDEIGRKLGCNCNIPGKYKIAYCSGLSILLGPSGLQLPERINVSSQVKVVDFSSNVIEEINENTFGDITSVSDLILAKNKIKTFDRINGPRILKLDLSFNKLTNLTKASLSKLKRIEYLDLSNNKLMFIDYDAFTQLEYLTVLKIGYNPLESIWSTDYPFGLQNMPALTELYLQNGSLIDFPVDVIQGTPNLRKLDLSNNHFSLLPEQAFDLLTSLEELVLSGNLFVHLPPNGFRALLNLKKLALDRLMLETIAPYTFANLSSLTTLSCRYNPKLTTIDAMAFRGDREQGTVDCNPKVVQLGHNNLQGLEFHLLVWPQLEDLELYGNDFQCDCELAWVPEYHRASPVNASMLADTDFKCAGPAYLEGIPVFEIEPTEMYCSSKSALVAGVIAVAVCSLILVAFCTLLVLSYLGILPSYFDKYLVILSNNQSPHKYSRVQPKPHTVYEIGTAQENPTPFGETGEMDWDPSDIGPYGNRLT